MSSSRSRIGVLAGGMVACFAIVLLHLWGVMVRDHDVWAVRSQQNRWSFRAVPSVRGSIYDRTGHLLAHDEPTMELALYYQRFRLRHAVGAAVHGATLWAQLQPGGEGTNYSYLDGVLGPEAAARDLLAMPASALRPGRFPKRVTADLAWLATTVLSTCSGLPRKRVFAAMRQAAQVGGDTTLGEVLPGTTPPELLGAYGSLLAALHRFEAELVADRADRRLRLGQPPLDGGLLFPELERLRAASLAAQRVERKALDGTPMLEADGTPQYGDLVETIAWSFAAHVPFELAASLRVGASQHPGLEITPSVQRISAEPEGSSLRALLGLVLDVDKVEKAREWVADYLLFEMEEAWLDDLVPAEAVGSDAERERLQNTAKQTFSRAMLMQARRGISGVEAGFDGALNGQLGMRLVERDARRREHQLWSSLRVESGDDVALTLDLGLQRLAETVVRRAQASMVARFADAADRDRVEAGLVVIDAQSGDLLALVGAPVMGANPRNVPGVTWRGNGSLGSVIKPFVLLEQLQAEAQDRAHLATAAFAPCTGVYPFAGQRLKCGHAHGAAGAAAVSALAMSCNSYFYQAAVGLGEDAVRRAMRRVGLLAPGGAGDPFAACWQDNPRGLPLVRPRWTGERDQVLPRRAIGYGVEASPASVARAYAALATGRLPTLGLRLGERRPSVPLGDLEPELAVVREGLRECVDTGTAKDVAVLADFRVHGKTGTAEVGDDDKENNVWFAGYLPWTARDGVQLCFCSVIYWVPDGVHGGDAAARMVGDLLQAVAADTELQARYLRPGGGR